MTLPNPNEVRGKWQQQVGTAKILWGKLSDDEILKTEGQLQRLAGLIQERYGVTRDSAEEQVKGFLRQASILR